MNEPTKYKSLSYSETSSRQGVQLDSTTKQKAFTILDKFVELFKLKHL